MIDAAPTEQFTPIRPFMEARRLEPGGPMTVQPPGAELAALRDAADDFRAAVLASGVPDAVRTVDLITLPYPTRFGLFRAPMSPAPFLWITNRLFVVQWTDTDRRPRTLLWEPSDHERGDYTPYFDRLKRRNRLPESVLTQRHNRVLQAVRSLGIDPADVDYLAFDHLHTQDCRRLVGTNGPAPDLGAFSDPVEPWFPAAKLISQVREWETIRHLHPQQVNWYQPATYEDLRPEGLLFVDGDVLLGPGVALMYTPGHTYGNMTLVLNTNRGLWTLSENGIAAECWTPRASRIPGVRRWATEWCQDVVLNANTLEFTAWQYDSMVAEALVADPTPGGDFRQTFPTSELTPTLRSPGTAPTYTHRAIHHGTVRASVPVRA